MRTPRTLARLAAATVVVVVLAGCIAAALFLFDQFYLPQANKRQDALRNRIKGKAAQTYLRPERKWIFGERSVIYYYEFFDPDQNRFASIQAFEVNPQTLELKRRIFATGALAAARWGQDKKPGLYAMTDVLGL